MRPHAVRAASALTDYSRQRAAVGREQLPLTWTTTGLELKQKKGVEPKPYPLERTQMNTRIEAVRCIEQVVNHHEGYCNHIGLVVF